MLRNQNRPPRAEGTEPSTAYSPNEHLARVLWLQFAPALAASNFLVDPCELRDVSLSGKDMTTIKDALKAFEAKTGEVAVDSTKVLLYGQFPPIQKMDIALGALKNCEQLSISSNNIDRISGLKGMEKLKILSLGRNLLKALQGLEDVADTLEEIWVSYNSIDKLAGLEACTKLKVLYMANNLIKDWKEIDRLKSCVQLEELLLVGNPIVEASGDQFRIQIAGRLPWLKKLDGNPIDEEERELGRAAVPQ